MKLYSQYNKAKKEANGRMILRVADFYLVGDFKAHDQIEIITSEGYITAHVGLKHLERLGNANWATPHPELANVAVKKAFLQEVA